MITINDISKIIDDSKAMNHDIKVKDIAYLILLRSFKDKDVVYTTLFGKDFSKEELNKYDKGRKMRFLKSYLNGNYPDTKNKNVKELISEDSYEDISFKENKAYMLKIKKKTEEGIKSGDIPMKDGLKILADLSVKLNNNFEVSDKGDEQRIVVMSCYNDICPHCGHEVRTITREDVIEELKKEYKLTPIEDNERENETED